MKKFKLKEFLLQYVYVYLTFVVCLLLFTLVGCTTKKKVGQKQHNPFEVYRQSGDRYQNGSHNW
jgi:outer membrane protein assembly factor BamD (BamD/ComL family)